jgi:hypothetical protein
MAASLPGAKIPFLAKMPFLVKIPFLMKITIIGKIPRHSSITLIKEDNGADPLLSRKKTRICGTWVALAGFVG